MARLLVLLGSLLFAAVGGDGIDVEALRARVLPDRVESWQTIPWRTDLGAARREAAGQGKLLFLWSMNGHPCGST